MAYLDPSNIFNENTSGSHLFSFSCTPVGAVRKYKKYAPVVFSIYGKRYGGSGMSLNFTFMGTELGYSQKWCLVEDDQVIA